MGDLENLNALVSKVKRWRRRLMPADSNQHLDGRRKYDEADDKAFSERLDMLKGNQTALAAELGISRQAVAKRSARIHKERGKAASNVIAALQLLEASKGQLFD